MGRAWALERCTAPFRALLGPLVVPPLNGVGVRTFSRTASGSATWFCRGLGGHAGLGRNPVALGRFFLTSGHLDVQKERLGSRLGFQKDRYSDGQGVGMAVLVDAVGVARNVVAAASSRVAECCFLVR